MIFDCLPDVRPQRKDDGQDNADDSDGGLHGLGVFDCGVNSVVTK
jgi:hypothetical protein